MSAHSDEDNEDVANWDLQFTSGEEEILDEAAEGQERQLPAAVIQQEALDMSQKDSDVYRMCKVLPIYRLKTFLAKLHKVMTQNYPSEPTTCATQTKYTGSIFRLLTTVSYQSALKELFITEELSAIHLQLGRRFVCSLQKWMIQQTSKEVEEIQALPEEATKMIADLATHGAGAATLRNIGGYVVGKLHYRTKKVLNHKLSDAANRQTKLGVSKVDLLKSMMISKEELKSTTIYPVTLQETERKEYGRLTYIKDNAYEFFSLLEVQRLKKLTVPALIKTGGALPAVIIRELSTDVQVCDKWHQLSCSVPTPDLEKKPKNESSYEICSSIVYSIVDHVQVCSNLKTDIISLFMGVGVNEFRKNVKRTFEVDKSLAHRNKNLGKGAKKRRKKTTATAVKASTSAVDEQDEATTSKEGDQTKKKTVKRRKKTDKKTKSSKKTKKGKCAKNDAATLTAGAEEEEEGECPICDLKFTDDVDWAECDKCCLWVCRDCSCISESLWTDITEQGAAWICPKCE